MDQITITREEFREKIVDNPEGFGIVRHIRKDPKLLDGHETRALMEELALMMVLKDIETELFGPKEE